MGISYTGRIGIFGRTNQAETLKTAVADEVIVLTGSWPTSGPNSNTLYGYSRTGDVTAGDAAPDTLRGIPLVMLKNEWHRPTSRWILQIGVTPSGLSSDFFTKLKVNGKTYHTSAAEFRTNSLSGGGTRADKWTWVISSSDPWDSGIEVEIFY